MNFIVILLALLLAVCVALLLIERRRARRFVRWITDPAHNPMPEMSATWGLAAAYTRRALGREQAHANESAARLATLLAALDALPVGIVLLDREGRILFCNAIAAAHFELDPARDRGQHIVHLVRDPAFVAWHEQHADTPLEMTAHPDAPGLSSRLMVQRQPYGDDCALLLFTDVTAQRQTEAMRRDFVANVSHEIRTPLTVLAGFVETLQSLTLSRDEQTRYLALMAQQTTRMQALVADLLTLSRLEGSPPPGMNERADLRELTTQCAAETHALSVRLYGADAQKIEIETAPDFDLAATPAELRSAMSNLLANAVRYSGAKGKINARWSRENNGGARFEVADNGPGIAPDHLPRLTERFYRVDRSRARHAHGEDGTGLGLAIVKHVAERHGGTLQIISILGQGSRFALVFPQARVVAGQTEKSL
ncbi:MAG: phosphate regulon sensor histidine kinase PhoR [Methylobacillus sp.]|nr:phosphate regulon sensor histidine kinase PhoR [Methylobacillus sp.]